MNGKAGWMQFIKAIFSEWGSGVTGGLSAPLFLFALFVSGVPRRPSVPIVGQLPFEAAVTRGEALRGMDVLVRPTQPSFNYMVVGAIVGAVVLRV